AAYVAVEVVSYEKSYPTAASRARLAAFQDNPAVRMLQGLGRDLDTTGGFVAWDGGWFLETVVAVWALLAVLRITRGDEETDRSALVLLAPLRARRVLVLQLLTVVAGGLLYAAACTVVLVAYGVPVGGALVFGLGLAGFAASIAGAAAVAAQLFAVRRRAVGTAAGLLAAAYLLRMAGNSTASAAWLRWLTPYGWMDDLEPYGDPHPGALALLLLAPVALGLVALRLRDRRDTGGAILSGSDSRAARTRWLGSPVGFAWRSSRGVLLAWATGLAAYAALMGSLLPTMTQYLLDDPGFRKAMTTFGIDVNDITAGMVSFMATVFGLGFALYACWRVGAARGEEESGRADLLLVRPLARRRWLGGHVLLAGGSVLALALVTGTATWGGGRLADADLTLGQALRASLNTVPPALVFLGLAVLLLGVRPRLTVVLSATAAAVAYLLPTVGTALSLPMWVRDLSPFQHLAAVPAHPWAATPGLVLLGLAAALAVAGVAAFDRRDLSG
ncbi:MAG: hypothetical protein ACXVFU_17390, partial [Nocardioidaceae bacterium]